MEAAEVVEEEAETCTVFHFSTKGFLLCDPPLLCDPNRDPIFLG